MSDDLNDTKITIFDVENGDASDRENLMGCFFEAQTGTDVYEFFTRGGEHIQTIPEFLTTDTPGFQFIRAGILWTVSDFSIDQTQTPQTASGTWRNPRNPVRGDDDGTFQAQSGGGVEQNASSASA
jgi:hypothetical protein